MGGGGSEDQILIFFFHFSIFLFFSLLQKIFWQESIKNWRIGKRNDGNPLGEGLNFCIYGAPSQGEKGGGRFEQPRHAEVVPHCLVPVYNTHSESSAHSSAPCPQGERLGSANKQTYTHNHAHRGSDRGAPTNRHTHNHAHSCWQN